MTAAVIYDGTLAASQKLAAICAEAKRLAHGGKRDSADLAAAVARAGRQPQTGAVAPARPRLGVGAGRTWPSFQAAERSPRPGNLDELRKHCAAVAWAIGVCRQPCPRGTIRDEGAAPKVTEAVLGLVQAVTGRRDALCPEVRDNLDSLNAALAAVYCGAATLDPTGTVSMQPQAESIAGLIHHNAGTEDTNGRPQ